MSHPVNHEGLYRTVLKSIEKNAWLEMGDSLLLAVSGGADSVALLHLFHKLAPRLTLRLAVAHLDHGLRGRDSDTDRAFVEASAQKLGLACYSDKRDVDGYRKKKRLSLEEAARKVRYDFLFETAERHGFNKVATAHHADDNAELILMNLMRGSGPAGLGGMDALSFEGRLIRPLLGVTRSDILKFLSEEQITFREDASNRDPAFVRNRIRNELIPHMERDFQPELSRILNRTARIIKDDEHWLDSLVEPLFHSLVREVKPGRMLQASLGKFIDLPRAARRRIIRKAVAQLKGDLRRIGMTHVDSALSLILGDKPRTSVDLPGRIRILRDGDTLVFAREDKPLRQTSAFEPAPDIRFEHRISEPRDGRIDRFLPETGQCFRFSLLSGKALEDPRHRDPGIALLDMDRLSFPLTLRNIRPGDRFRPLGMGGHQRLSDFFINSKIPAANRKSSAVLVSGNDIAWVCGHRISEEFKVRQATEKILKIELLLA